MSFTWNWLRRSTQRLSLEHKQLRWVVIIRKSTPLGRRKHPKGSQPCHGLEPLFGMDEHFAVKMTPTCSLPVQCSFLCFNSSSYSLSIGNEREAVVISCVLTSSLRNPLVHEMGENSPAMASVSQACFGPCSHLLCWKTKCFCPLHRDRRKRWTEFSCSLWGQIGYVWSVTNMEIFAVKFMVSNKWIEEYFGVLARSCFI